MAQVTPTTQFRNLKDVTGQSESFQTNVSNSNDAYIGTGNAQTITVPTGATRVTFSTTGNFWIGTATNGAAIPAAQVLGVSPLLNPAGLSFENCDGNAFAAAAACIYNATAGVVTVFSWWIA